MWPTVCPRSLDPIYIANYYLKGVKTSWTDSMFDPVLFISGCLFIYGCGPTLTKAKNK